MMPLSSTRADRPVARGGTFSFGDLAIHRLGFGTMRLTTGPGTWGPPRDRDRAKRVLRRAVDLGVDFIDTADSYGPGDSEEMIAEALHPYPEHIVIATKAGLVRTGPATGLSRELRRAPEFHPVGRPEYLRQQCEMSLRRLRLERLDLFYLHRVDPLVDIADQFGLLADLQREGKVRHVGISEVTVPDLETARAIVPIAAVQNLYHPYDRASDGVLAYCQQHRIGFVPWFPLGAGQSLSADGPIVRIAREVRATPAQVALAWLLAKSDVMLPIPGTSSLEHLEENCHATSIVLSDAARRAIDGIAGVGITR